jgi:hypothetical protein
VWRAATGRRHAGRGAEPRHPFTLALAAIIGLSLLGLPIGLSMITGSIIYLALSGRTCPSRRSRC